MARRKRSPKGKNPVMAAWARRRWAKATKAERLKVGRDLARARKKAKAAREVKTQK